MINPNNVKAGDVLIGLESSGVHSNGFSLVRKVFDIENKDVNRYVPELSQTLGEALLTPTKIYVKPVLKLIDSVRVKSVCHITGGGFYENIPRALAKDVNAKIDKSALNILPIFELIAKEGNIPERDMFNTYNMGTGMCIAVSKLDADKAVAILNDNGEKAKIIGEVTEGSGEVEIC